jgi:hypothetical protein
MGDRHLRVFKSMKDFLEGVWAAQKTNLARPLIKAKTYNDDAMIITIFGDFLGYPFQSTFYSRLLFVYWLERITPWRKRILKEKDFTDM